MDATQYRGEAKQGGRYDDVSQRPVYSTPLAQVRRPWVPVPNRHVERTHSPGCRIDRSLALSQSSPYFSIPETAGTPETDVEDDGADGADGAGGVAQPYGHGLRLPPLPPVRPPFRNKDLVYVATNTSLPYQDRMKTILMSDPSLWTQVVKVENLLWYFPEGAILTPIPTFAAPFNVEDMIRIAADTTKPWMQRLFAILSGDPNLWHRCSEVVAVINQFPSPLDETPPPAAIEAPQ